MRLIISKIVFSLIIAEAVAILYFGFNAYFLTSVNDGTVYDGLGREVTRSPWLFNLIVRQETWPGAKWFIIDTLLFWLSIGVGYVLLTVKENLES